MMEDSLKDFLMGAFFAGFSEGCDGMWVEGDPSYAWEEYIKTLEIPCCIARAFAEQYIKENSNDHS